jgi:hypothetical protein
MRCTCFKRYDWFQTRRNDILKMHFFKKWPEIMNADNPNNIKWNNIGVTKAERGLRMCGVWMVAILILLGSLLFFVFVNTGKVYIKGLSGKTALSCPKVYLD